MQLASNQNGGTTASSDTTVVSISGLTKTVSVPKTTTAYYKIRKGDTWAAIARKNGVTVSELKESNKTNKLIAGKQLKIVKTEYVEIQEVVQLPEPEVATVILDSTYTADLIDDYLKKIVRDESTLPRVRISATDAEDGGDRASTDDAKTIYHKVKIGETISQIAARYNVSKEDIVTWNKLSSNMAKVGQRLLILLPDQETERNEGSQANTADASSMANS
ncbi:LysM peptidoglycan-binding domain-containing protein [Dysgonomonas sp. Marseille-P4677]|uniref:LysM peptidoglycan-binding domain-containing protein n=1 Tax=Dysgonomonas sp. Marseille-P4677 TaxID=2364790 RepID=UPI00351C6BE5